MAARKKRDPNRVVPVEDYEHSDSRRTNNPPAGLAHLDRDATPLRRFEYDPHLDPALIWAGKSERPAIDVPAPSIHVHEELSAERIVDSVRRQRTQAALFDVDSLDPAKQVEFYKHDLDWSNRLVLGDSLLVMTSLLERERLGGQAQMVYIDPPYGVNYKSNFQPTVSSTEVTQNDDGLTREPEMIQAYRDTWELGIHSYLTYLRDRMRVARELLHPSGSIFVQISDDHMHQVRSLLDEVFGAENYVAQITFQKTANTTGKNLGIISDYLLWYARNKDDLKYRQLYTPRQLGDPGSGAYNKVLEVDGTVRPLERAEFNGDKAIPKGARVFRAAPLTSQSIGRKKGPGAASWFEVEVDGRPFTPGASSRWKTNEEGMERLREAGRLFPGDEALSYVRFLDDFNGVALQNIWTDTAMSGSADRKRYVVQTNPKVVARCVAMTTDPGDLVVDPTCGSGTTALVCEDFGRRWITTDTSRVALAVARERMVTAKFDYYELVDERRGVDGGLVYETQSRVTLGQIAKGQEPEIVAFHDRPRKNPKKIRVSGPFTVEALSRYATNPLTPEPLTTADDITGHVDVLLAALEKQGVPRPGKPPLPISSLSRLPSAGPIHAEGIVETEAGGRRFGVVLGPRFGTISMAMVSDALRQAVGFEFMVFAGFAADTETQARLGEGRMGGIDVALLLANPDLLVGDLLKNTTSSQTFRLYASPDVALIEDEKGWRIEVNGVDSYDAATEQVISTGRSGVVAWFLDDNYDGTVFRVSQALFPISDAWEKLERALQGTVDADLVAELHSWTSLPFDASGHERCAVRVVTADGNAAEAILSLGGA